MFWGKIIAVILLKKSIIVFLETVFFTALLLMFFIGIGYFYLSGHITKAQNEVENVPYYDYVPQNTGLLFSVLDNKTLAYLDFENESLRICFVDGDISQNSVYGYDIDYEIESDLGLVAEIVDILGGIDLDIDGETLNYTGTQIKEILERNTDDILEQQIIKCIIRAVGNNGFTKNDFLAVIENSETNLTMPDCYDWENYIDKLCKNAVFVN